MATAGDLDALLDQAARHYAAGRTSAAARLLRQAKAMAPRNPTVRLRYAMAIWHGEDRAEEALRELAALGREYPQAPIFATEATIQASLGQFAAAAAAARRALAADPAHTSAWLDLATATDAGGAPAVLGDLAAALPEAKTDKQRQDIHHAAARLCRKLGRTDAAWEHTVQANDLQQPKWDAAKEAAFRAELRDVFTPDLMTGLAGKGPADARMIFVLGLPRSGTTLLERMLAGHPEIASVGETPVAGGVYMQLRRQGGDAAGIRSRLTPDVLGAAAKAILDGMAPRLRDANPARIIDKMPANTLFVPFLSLALPRATIVYMRRHPIDIGLSCYEASFAFGLDYATRLDLLGQAIRMEIDLMDHWRGLPGVAVHEVRYEDLTAEPEPVLRAVLARAGLAWDPACLAPARTGMIKTASVEQARGQLSRASIGRWEALTDRLQPMIDAMGGRAWAEAAAARPANR